MKIVAVTASTAIVTGIFVMSGFQGAAPAKMTSEQALIEGFKKSTVASVADAVDQITGQRGFMSHDMRPRVPGVDGGPGGHGATSSNIAGQSDSCTERKALGGDDRQCKAGRGGRNRG